MTTTKTMNFSQTRFPSATPASHRKRKVFFGAMGVLLVGCVASGWLSRPDYTYRPPVMPVQEDTDARGLTVLVSFSDRQFTSAQAALVYRALNEKDFVHTEAGKTYRGSVRDYFSDMSQGKFVLQSRVVHVRLPHAFAAFDTDAGDDLAPFTSTTQLEDVEFVGPLAQITQAVTCKVADCSEIDTRGWPVDTVVEFQEVTASGFGPIQSSGDVFSGLDRKPYSFWFDNFLREISESNYLLDPNLARRWAEIPNIDGFRYFNVMYSGDTAQSRGKGLWPRSVPHLETVVDPVSGVPIVHPQVLGTKTTSGMPELPLLIHESAHTLFDLPDLYDSGLERDVSPVVPDFQSRGVGTHELMGLPPPSDEAPLMGAPMRDRLGWANVVDISELAEGTVVELDANSAQTARYCRPHSPMQECFYIEARLKDGKRFGTNRTAYIPDSGLAIWHSEYRKDVTDFVVNNHEEADRNLHFEVALMQADGNRDLEKGVSGGEGNDYFRQGRQDFFDEHGSVNSKWWDGSPSGLALRNISASGTRMSFVVGKRPQADLSLTSDSHVRATWDKAALRVGETRRIAIQVDPGYAFDVIAAEDKYLARHQTAALDLDVKGQLDGMTLRLVSYSASAAGPSLTGTADVYYRIAEGARVSSYVQTARTYETTSRMFDRRDYWANFYASAKTTSSRTPDMKLPLSVENTQLPLNVVADEGFVLTSLRVLGRSNGYSKTLTGPTTRFTADLTLPSAPDGYDVVVETEPVVSYFCSANRVPAWNPDKVYSDLGDKVRYQDAVYSSNVPRAFLRASGATPANSSNHWTKFVDCSTTAFICSGTPAWSPGVSSNSVLSGGLLYDRFGKPAGEENGAMPGNHVSYLIDDAAERFARVSSALPLYSNRAFAYPDDSDWSLIGACSDSPGFKRAMVQVGAGVTNLSSTLPLKAPTSSTPRLSRDPYFVDGVSSGWRLTFSLEPGYTLDGVYVNGVRQSGIVVGSAFTVPVTNGARAPHVEIRTNCSNAQCRTTASVSCQITVDSQWNSPTSSGFNGRMTIKNTTAASLSSWSSQLSIRPSSASWQSVWTSVGATTTLTGPDAKVTKAGTQLGANQSTVVSLGGQWNGAFVTPTCQGL